MEAIYLLRRLIEGYNEKIRALKMVYIDLENTYDSVFTAIMLWIVQKKNK